VKRILTTLLILAAFVGIASADFVQSWGPKLSGYIGTGIIRGTQACTLSVPLAVVANAKWLVFRVRADSVVDSVPNLQAAFWYKHPILTANAWVKTSFASPDAGDTILPLDGQWLDTLTTQTVLLPHYSTLWSMPGATFAIVLTGKRASQCAKACSTGVWVKK
jgi:hypothetical protein